VERDCLILDQPQLGELGFRTTLRIQSWNEFDIYEKDTQATTGLVRWGADYMAASNFIEPLFGCNSGAENIYRFCDRTLDRQLARALAAPQTDVAAWSAADRRVVDLAPAVPLDPALGGAGLQARGQCQDAPAAVHAGGSDVGPLVLD
jgi:peptide/nickel transport system substrate-binding protein